jgi:hypothetical protein
VEHGNVRGTGAEFRTYQISKESTARIQSRIAQGWNFMTIAANVRPFPALETVFKRKMPKECGKLFSMIGA